MSEEERANQDGNAITRKTIGWIVFHQLDREEAEHTRKSSNISEEMKTPRHIGDWTVRNVTLDLSPPAESDEQKLSSLSNLGCGREFSTMRGWNARRILRKSTKVKKSIKIPDCRTQYTRERAGLPDVVNSTWETQARKYSLKQDAAPKRTAEAAPVRSTSPSSHTQEEPPTTLGSVLDHRDSVRAFCHDDKVRRSSSNACLNRIRKSNLLSSIQQAGLVAAVPPSSDKEQHPVQFDPSFAVAYHSRSDLINFCKAQQDLHSANAAPSALPAPRKPLPFVSMYKRHNPANHMLAWRTEALPELISSSVSKHSAEDDEEDDEEDAPPVMFGSFRHHANSTDPAESKHFPLQSGGSYVSLYLQAKQARQEQEEREKSSFGQHSVVGHSSVIHCTSRQPPRPHPRTAAHDGSVCEHSVVDPNYCHSLLIQRMTGDHLRKITGRTQEIIKGIKAKSSCRYPNPFEGANPRFRKRISELNLLVTQTVRWENNRAMKATAALKSATSS